MMRYKLSIFISLVIVSLGVGYFFWQKSARHFVEYASTDGDLHLVWQNAIKPKNDRDLFYAGLVNDLLSQLPHRSVAQDGKALMQGYAGERSLKKLLKEAGVTVPENYTLPSKIYFTLEKEGEGFGFILYKCEGQCRVGPLGPTATEGFAEGSKDPSLHWSVRPNILALFQNFPLLDDAVGVNDILPVIKQIVPKNNVQIIYSTKPIDPDSFDLKDFKYSIISSSKEPRYINWEDFEKQISTVLGKKFTLKRKKILPDKTEVEEIISNPNKFQWQKDGTLSFLEAREYGLELAYVLRDNILIFGNDLEEVRRLKETFSPKIASFLDQDSRLLYLNNKKIEWRKNYLKRPSGLLIRWFENQAVGRVYFKIKE